MALTKSLTRSLTRSLFRSIMTSDEAVVVAGNFNITVKTDNTGTSTDFQFTLPLNGSSVYNVDVDWGDGNTDTIITNTPFTHTYSSIGTYDIKIGINGNNTFPAMEFANGGDAAKLLDVSAWGDIVWGSFSQAFQGCLNSTFTATDAPDLSVATNMDTAFRECSSMGAPDWNAWDVSNISLFTSMLRNAGNPKVSSWIPTAMTSMSSFARANSNFNRSINTWVTPNLTSCSTAFFQASAYNQDTGDLDITGVASLSQFLSGTAMSTANYDATLIGFNAQSVLNNVTFGGPSAQYCSVAAVTAHDALIADHSWIITDGGLCTSTLQDTDGNTLQDTSGNTLQDTN